MKLLAGAILTLAGSLTVIWTFTQPDSWAVFLSIMVGTFFATFGFLMVIEA